MPWEVRREIVSIHALVDLFVRVEAMEVVLFTSRELASTVVIDDELLLLYCNLQPSDVDVRYKKSVEDGSSFIRNSNFGQGVGRSCVRAPIFRKELDVVVSALLIVDGVRRSYVRAPSFWLCVFARSPRTK